MRKFLPILRVLIVLAIIGIFFGIPSLIVLKKQGVIKNPVQNYIKLEPKIVSIPPLTANKGQEYIYRLNIDNFNKDKHYIEVQRPNWLIWDDSLWILSGKVPDNKDFNIKISVIDLNTHEILDSQDFIVKVTDTQTTTSFTNNKNNNNDNLDESLNAFKNGDLPQNSKEDTINANVTSTPIPNVAKTNSTLEIVQKTSCDSDLSKSAVLGATTDDNIDESVNVSQDTYNSDAQTSDLSWQDPFIVDANNSDSGQVLGATTTLPTTAISPIGQIAIGISILSLGTILYTTNLALKRRYKTDSGLDILVITGKND